MPDLSPKREPVAWATGIGLAIAAAISYGLHITDAMRDFLIWAVPIAIAAWVARSKVTPVAKGE